MAVSNRLPSQVLRATGACYRGLAQGALRMFRSFRYLHQMSSDSWLALIVDRAGRIVFVRRPGVEDMGIAQELDVARIQDLPSCQPSSIAGYIRLTM